MRIDVSAQLVAFPRFCACCGQPPEQELQIAASRSRGVKVVRTTTHTWPVPYCHQCAAHVADWNGARWASIVGVSVGAVAGFVFFLASCATGFVVFVVLTVAGLVTQGLLRRRVTKSCSTQCASPHIAAQFLGWDGSLQAFDFMSRGYAAEFLASNASKLVNVTPDAYQLLNAALQSRQALAAAQLAHARSGFDRRLAEAEAASSEVRERAAARRETDDHARWIGRIEAAKGPAGRRAALAAALSATTRDDLRAQLMLEASRIEVQAALDKADLLKTPAAKLRTLRAALEAIRNDEVPDHLQADQIRWLEEAIAEAEREAAD